MTLVAERKVARLNAEATGDSFAKHTWEVVWQNTEEKVMIEIV